MKTLPLEEIRSIATNVWECGARELLALAQGVDLSALQQVVEACAHCRGRVVTCGTGTSGAAAKKIAHSLSCVEVPAFFLDAADAIHGGLGAVQPGDVVILISKGGNTAEITRLIPSLAAKNVSTIGVSENPDSHLARHCSIFLKIKVQQEADTFNMLATTSTMAVIAVFDAICIALMTCTGYTREQFAIIHPGGAVGERLVQYQGTQVRPGETLSPVKNHH